MLQIIKQIRLLFFQAISWHSFLITASFPVKAATGIYHTLNFQGKVVNKLMA